MDMSQSVEPRSDQWNADDLITGPVTVTISEVIKGAAEQPFDFKLVESDRVYRPSKTSRRVIIAAWGTDTKVYAGRRLTLYREPSIMFGGQKVGGIRISHMSDIAGTVEVMAQTTRGKREKFTVQPLASSTDRPDVEKGAQPSEVVDAPNSQDGGQDTNGGSATGAAEPPTVPLKQAVEEQLAALTSHQKARLAVLCTRLEIKPSRDGLMGAWGESCRDLVSMIDQVEARVTSK